MTVKATTRMTESIEMLRMAYRGAEVGGADVVVVGAAVVNDCTSHSWRSGLDCRML